jgi:hypothetical protein
MQLAHRIKILETNSSKVMVDSDYLFEEKPEVRQELCKIDEKSEALLNLRHDVNTQAAKISALDEHITLLESNGEIMTNCLERVEHNIRVMRNSI